MNASSNGHSNKDADANNGKNGRCHSHVSANNIFKSWLTTTINFHNNLTESLVTTHIPVQ